MAIAPATITPGTIRPAAILDAVRAAVPAVASGAAEREAARELPYEQVVAIRDTGLLTLRVPARYGGPGGSLTELLGAVIDVAAADPNLAQGLRSHFGFVESRLARAQSPETEAGRLRWFPEVLNGKVVGLAWMELGRTPATFGTTLADGVLNGRKYYSTGSLFADLIETTAVDPDGRHVNLVVPADRAGVTRLDDFDAMGQRLTASGSTVFENVRVYPDEIAAVFRPDDPDQPLTYLGGFYQLYLAAVAAGIARNAFTDATAYVRDRARPAVHAVASTAAQDPYILQAAGEIGALAYAAEAVVLRAAAALDVAAAAAPGDDVVIAAAVDVAKAQLTANRAAMEAGQRIFDTGGASATSTSLNLSRHWRNARTIASHNPLAYKARAAGDYAVNGAVPPRSGYF
jgi:alkylation response protein AidB-like acyl-CoA dehydrogenase